MGNSNSQESSGWGNYQGHWKDIHRSFSEWLQNQWQEQDFNHQSAKEWVDAGFTPWDLNDVLDWRSCKFIPEQVKGWKNLVFTFHEAKWWIEVGLEREDYEFAAYLRWKNYQSKQNWRQLRKEYNEWKKTPSIQGYLDVFYPLKKRKEIKVLNISQKNLTGTLNLTGFRNLEELCAGDNNFIEQDLSFLENLKRLKRLNLGNCEQSIIQKNIYNRFKGSLKYLRNLTELEELNISNTDISSGVEHLPDNLKNIFYSTKERPESKLKEIKCQLDLFASGKWKKWREQGFTIEQTEEWINAGAKPSDYEFAYYLKKDDYQYTDLNESNIGQLRERCSWQDIHPDFNYQARKHWERKSFDKEKTQEWIQAGAKPSDYEFVAWFRDTKNLGPEWITNYKEDYQVLSDRFKKYNLCEECRQPNTGENWCKDCNSKHLEQDFDKWSSSSYTIDKFIQKYQLEATEVGKLLEWIPHEQFTNIEYLAEGGFGKVYKAKWAGGNIYKWDKKDSKWERCGDKKTEKHKTVVLKILSNSRNITQEFLEEIKNHKVIDDWFQNIVPCYGISRDPQSENYLIVMEYVEGGNLRKYLQKDYHKLDLNGKLRRLINITQGLKDIHQQDLIHRDFHSGNILSDNRKCFITDLGLSKLSKEANDGKIMGVLPYVAPEVLRNKGYSQASDIYSFGIIAWEILSGLPPYHNIPHDEQLAIKICKGLRPNLNEAIAPQLLKSLISKCWDADFSKRPVAYDLVKDSRKWEEEIRGNWLLQKKGKKCEFYQQYLEIEKIIQVEKEKKVWEMLVELYKRYKGRSIEVKPREIQKIKGELYFEFCKKHNYEVNSREVKEKFEKLFFKASNPNYIVHPSAVYTSRLLDFKNLPEPQNSKEINEEFWNSQGDSRIIVNSTRQKILLESEEIPPIEIKEEQLQTQQETPPKK